MCRLCVGAPELVAALDWLWFARAALVGLGAALLHLLNEGSFGSWDSQLVAIAVECYERVYLGDVVHERAIWRLGDGAAVEVLDMLIGRDEWGAEGLFHGVEVGRCRDGVEVGCVVFWCVFWRQNWVVVARWRAGIAETLRIDATLIAVCVEV